MDIRRFPGTRFATWVFFLYLYLPIVILIALSFNENRSATIWTGFTTDWYVQVMNNGDILNAAKNSLIVALWATVIATCAATFAALGMARRRFKGQTAVSGVLAMPLVVPEIVTAVASLLFFILVGFDLGLLTVVVAHTVFCIPFAYLPIRARIEGMDPRLGEAAADLYADEMRTFLRVTLPLLWPGILAGAMLAFIISLDDFVITYFVAGAGATTLPVYIFGAIRIGISPEVNAISSLMLIVSLLFVSLSTLLTWWAGRRGAA
ncbi:ABC transporter permease [Caenispirillum bisanense]|uniref:Spermidine/putrescine transport system permease protein PotC n=1 Tax=Caenispirillum bisanense TaxID=414052 RepID=A0A286GZP1_9PROT|nr:ABC transporter permease [Caenispirillum bisanense]SOE01008.1 spermidine/putrescine transport system permease protein [Caenispirillum bisanense]